MQNIYFPNIQKVQLTNFSLFSESSMTMDFSKSVSCLMGANGIGKSTMLNCINFGLTGYINEPDKKIKSLKDFVESNSYHKEYFDGRITEVDKDFAEVEIEFILHDKLVTVKRNFFPSNEVTSFSIDGSID